MKPEVRLYKVKRQRARVRGWLHIMTVAAVLSFTVMSLPTQVAKASISACSATLTPHEVDSGSSNTYTFTLTNQDPDTIQWIRIARPSGDFTLTSANASGWSAQLTTDNATFKNGGLDQNNSLTLRVNAVVGNINQTQNWTLYATDDPAGSGQFACSGDLSVTVGQVANPVISSVAATSITTTSARITWTTNIASDSRVSYGLTAGYGGTASSSSQVTSHSLQLNNLSSATTYHYQVTSVTSQGGQASSGDHTFTTARPPSGNNNNTQVVTSPNTSDQTPPAISLEGQGGIFAQAPNFTGQASDNEGVVTVEYSTDGGKTWLPADSVEPASRRSGNREVNFNFTPLNLTDGDYLVVARASDAAGNQASTQPVKIVIDLLPPQVGGSMVTVGAQVVTPQSEGTTTAVAGVAQRWTLSAVGGPTSIMLIAQTGNRALDREFLMEQSDATGLWSAEVKFDLPGDYDLTARSVDGAGNQTVAGLGTIQVMPPAAVVEKGSNKPLAGVTATLHYFVPQTQSWTVWDGAAYGQNNPQTTDAGGRFQFYPPAGKYYLELKKPGWRHLYSQIFTLKQPQPLTATLEMQPAIGFQVGRLGWYLPLWTTAKVVLAQTPSLFAQRLEGKLLPAFNLIALNGQTRSSLDLVGKPSLVSFVSTWAPAARDQLPALASLQKDTGFNVWPVAVQEPPAKVAAYLGIAGYRMDMLADPNGQTFSQLKLTGLPVHLLVDRRGVVKKVMVGVLSEEELRKAMP